MIEQKNTPKQNSANNTDNSSNYAVSLVATKKQTHANTSWYRRAFGKALNFAVTPKIIGDVPSDIVYANNNEDKTPVVFYVLQERSRSNSQLIDNETRKLNLPPALAHVQTDSLQEKAAIIYIRHGQKDGFFAKKHAHSPRLFRLLQALQKNAKLDVLLVPVSINWGRDPGKEDSLIKLLTAESWANPTITKQLLNIGVHGRHTYLQFHPSINLRQLVNQVSDKGNAKSAIVAVEKHLSAYLHQQREIILGPDLSDRRTEVDKILYSPAIKHAIMEEGYKTNQLPKDLRTQARGYMNEIVSDYSSSFIRVCEQLLTWLWTQLYDGVQVHHLEGRQEKIESKSTPVSESDQSLRMLAEKYELVFLPCHRSHIDYLLIMYVLYINGMRTPYVAAGDNLNVPGVGPLLRRGGAFFLRRSFNGNYLYTSVFKEYLHNILTRNIALKFFIEGGRSRSGRLLYPKTGMLAMTLQSYLRDSDLKPEDYQASSDTENVTHTIDVKGRKPIAFIPTFIGYERLAEGGSYVGEMQGKPKEAESVFQLLKAMRKIERIYGEVHVNFGEPIFIQDILAKHKVDASHYDKNRNDQSLKADAQAAVNDLAIKTMQNINKAAVINPIGLLSLALLSTPKNALTEESCIAQLDLYREIAQKAPYDERTVITEKSGREIIDYAMKLKMVSRVKHIMGDMISVAEEQHMLLSYFKNNVLHVFIMPSMVAALVHHNGRMQKDDVLGIIEEMYPFIQSELFLKWKQRNIEKTVEHIIGVMLELGLVTDDGKGTLYTNTEDTTKHHQLSVLASPVQQTLKRYFMAIALLSQQGSGNMSKEQVVDLCFLLGQRMSVLYETDAPEFFDKALFKGFVNALLRNGFLQETVDEPKRLLFDENVDKIAENARFVLDAETLDTLKQLATLSEEDIKQAIAELEKKKQRRFSRKSSKAK